VLERRRYIVPNMNTSATKIVQKCPNMYWVLARLGKPWHSNAMLQAFLVFLGGGLGALGRWGFGLGAARLWGASWPWGTLGVNVIGGFVMGLVMGHLMKTGAMTPSNDNWRLFLATGVLGGFTTFSAFSLETAKMIEASQLHNAALYSVTSVVLCVAAVFAGMALSRLNG
jgi:fluoride exporter